MIPKVAIEVHPEVATALGQGRAVVALESTLIAHGLPRPLNLETARQLEEAVRAEGAVPATIGVWRGRPIVGLSQPALEEMATGDQVMKASRRDLAVAVVQGKTAATTVAATMFLAHLAGIRVFATGGIGGVHRSFSPLPSRERGGGEGADVSADLTELARTPVAVVCAGAKGILDIPRTLEMLETLGVPVIGWQTDEFPAFYVHSSGEKVQVRLDRAEPVAAFLSAHWELHGGGVVVAQSVAADVALEPAEFEAALAEAEKLARASGVKGKQVTPFLLARLAELTGGKTLRANQSLAIANARLAARIAMELAGVPQP